MNFSAAELEARKKFLPWIIVAVIAVLALLASFFVVNAVNNSGGNSSETTQSDTAKSESDEESSEKNSTAKPAVPKVQEVPVAATPQADPGQTFELDIAQLGRTVDISSKFGRSVRYEIPDGTQVILRSDLIESLPATCAEMRAQFGFKVAANGSFEVMKPDTVCSAAPEVYNEIWGLLEAAVKTQR
ncbi:hypothetical protein [Canibacter zhoujuaniae]|uniref:hypothetical protein n=1 Tax=Canibacter zhoujuaniae TaxID=2708343 RepID=UPI00141E8A36|nr:hypothetical protein [Canibacter zhoujuaniae]